MTTRDVPVSFNDVMPDDQITVTVRGKVMSNDGQLLRIDGSDGIMAISKNWLMQDPNHTITLRRPPWKPEVGKPADYATGPVEVLAIQGGWAWVTNNDTQKNPFTVAVETLVEPS